MKDSEYELFLISGDSVLPIAREVSLNQSKLRAFFVDRIESERYYMQDQLERLQEGEPLIIKKPTYQGLADDYVRVRRDIRSAMDKFLESSDLAVNTE